MAKVNMVLSGLLGVERKAAGVLVVHCVNAANPANLEVPDEYRVDIPSHLPRLLIRGADEVVAEGMPIQEKAASCYVPGLWKAISLLGWEIAFEGVTSTFDSSNLSLLRMSQIMTKIGQPGLEPDLSWPRTITSVKIEHGRISNGTSLGHWKFENAGGAQWELYDGILLDTDADPTFVLHLKWIRDPVIERQIEISHLSDVKLRIENNVIATEEAEECKGGYDFVGHYHVLASRPRVFPYPIEKVTLEPDPGGPSNNVQCSPIEYKP